MITNLGILGVARKVYLIVSINISKIRITTKVFSVKCSFAFT